MRTKSFLVFLTCVAATSLLLILLGPQRSESLHNIVSQTHLQIRNFQENLKEAQEKNLSADPDLLSFLGFGSLVLVNGSWSGNVSQPCIISYVLQDDLAQAVGLLRSVTGKLPRQSLLIYDLGLTSDDLLLLNTHCNSSKCSVIPFPLDQFPSHVSEEQVHAFRPLIIQDGLNKCGSVFMLENNRRINFDSEILQSLHNRTIHSGVLGWSTKHAVSSLTHPKMFEYFHTDAPTFYFLPMLGAEPLFMVNSQKLQKEVMLPWVQCALTQDCVHPIGAQSGGCRYDKKPQYRYSGCHAYDTSALNIVLGLSYNLDDTRYSLNYDELNMLPKESADYALKMFRNLRKNLTEVSDGPNIVSIT